MIHLVTGGSGSGKSAYAEKLVTEQYKKDSKYYIATMQVMMRKESKDRKAPPDEKR